MGIDKLFENVSNRNIETETEARRLSDLVKEITGIRNNLAFLKSEVAHLLKDTEYDPDYPELSKTIQGELIKMLELFPERYRVVIEVKCGIATISHCPDLIDVEIIDRDER